ncbi:MAG: response regulator transcription factor [Flavobacteriales bacterium]|nr:response regulator transcription factor [Flavobacteriales bacterium]
MKILVVEDEKKVSDFIKMGLEENGYETTQAFDGEMAVRLCDQNHYDLIVLDIILPKLNGLEVLKIIREKLEIKTHVIVLTALGSTEDVVSGLDAGADDYLVKPFKFQELNARIRALSRRNSTNTSSKVMVEDLEINMASKTVFRDGNEIELTAKEYRLLEYLIKNKGRVVSRVDILENVWEMNFDPGTNVVDVYMNYLRKKVDHGFSTKLINTKVGMGYVIK